MQKESFKVASIAGVLGGVLPDIDVLIKSSTDPLLALQFHRHFTHSLAMVPVLALPVAFVVSLFFKKITFKEIYLYAFLGVLTHGLLDACTSYGTQLLWPFSNMRVAWNNIAIIDPLFTLPALAGVIWAERKKNLSLARGIFAFMICYLLFGVYQREAATQVARELASKRNHNYLRIEAKPSIGSLALWRTLYETPEGVFFVDAVNTLPFLDEKIYEGASVKKWSKEKLFPIPSEESTLAKDIARFNWFSDDYLVKSYEHPLVIGDLRYATLPNSLEPLWGITFNPKSTGQHVDLQYFRVLDEETKSKFKKMLLRQDI
ncbi:MAG: metal-dependent hydrolase [Bdellovibrionota bacterium]